MAGLYAAYAAMMAVYERDVLGSGRGQVVDVALYEAVLGLMEGLIPEYDRAGVVRGRHGNRVSGIAPQGTYPCSDGHYVVIGGNGDAIFKRLMHVMGRDDLATDPGLQTNAGRAAAEDMLDDTIAAWSAQRTLEEVLATLEAAEVPVGQIYTAAEMMRDPHFLARGMIERVPVPGREPVRLSGVVPRLSRTPGQTRWVGPALGAHNREIYQEWLGISDTEMAELQAAGVI